MEDQPQARFHGGVKVQRNGTEIRVNIFENDREALYFEINQAIAQFSGDIRPATQAGRDIRQAEQAAAAKQFTPPKQQANGTRPQPNPNHSPVCQDCGTVEAVELISFSDPDSGQPLRRYKCQSCKKWLGKAF